MYYSRRFSQSPQFSCLGHEGLTGFLERRSVPQSASPFGFAVSSSLRRLSSPKTANSHISPASLWEAFH